MLENIGLWIATCAASENGHPVSAEELSLKSFVPGWFGRCETTAIGVVVLPTGAAFKSCPHAECQLFWNGPPWQGPSVPSHKDGFSNAPF